MKFKQKYWVGIVIALVLIVVDFYLYFILEFNRWFFPIIVLAITVGWLQFWIDFFAENKRQKELELKFVEFVRNLVGNVRSGVTITKGIVNVSDENYGALSPYVKKLARQLEWGIPLHRAMVIFSNDTENSVVKRAVSIIIEADESGGDIESILDAVAVSVMNIKKMKEERKASVYSQILQGYIVFFVFIGIMLVLQLWLFPNLQGSLDLEGVGGGFGLGELAGFRGYFQEGELADIDFIFFALILIQGFFAGIMVGKFSEGTIRHGLLHSLILMTSAALLVTTIKGGI